MVESRPNQRNALACNRPARPRWFRRDTSIQGSQPVIPILLALAAVNLILVLVLFWKLSTAAQVHATRIDLAQTQQAIADRLATALEGVRQSVHSELQGGRGEVSMLLTGLLNAQRQSLDSFQQGVEKRLETIRERTDLRLSEIGKQVQLKLDQNIQEGFRHFDKIQEHLRAAEQQLVGLNAVGNSITELNQLLKLPHMRGGFGESVLEQLLADFLPAAAFELQASIAGTQDRVDAVVRFPQHVLPVDSKFPREQVASLFDAADPAALAEARRTLSQVVKTQARRIARYIRPDAGTADMALMFLPSETLYFEVIRDTELFQALAKMKVFPVSPNTLAITLQSVALAHQYYEMALNVEETLKQVKLARRHFEFFERQFDEVGRGLEKAREAFDVAGTHLRRYTNSVARLTGEEEQLSLPEAGAAAGT